MQKEVSFIEENSPRTREKRIHKKDHYPKKTLKIFNMTKADLLEEIQQTATTKETQ